MAPILRWILILVLLVAGAYMLAFHTDPFPGNHEAIGLGKVHIVHDVIGVVLVLAAGYLWWTGRTKPATSPAP